MRRRGLELSLNLLIIIVLGLIVLAIVAYLVINYSRGFHASTTSCRDRGGECSSSPCPPGYEGSSFFTGGCEEGMICCIPENSLLGERE